MNIIKLFLFKIKNKYRQIFVCIGIKEARHRGFTFVRNVFGDEINHIECRSIWQDKKLRIWRVKELNTYLNGTRIKNER